MTYNGFKNYETWNVSLYINNEEKYYTIALNSRNYNDFLAAIDEDKTLDGVSFNDPKLSKRELNRLIKNIKE